MGITPIFPNVSAVQPNYNTDILEIPESHLIKGVPYVGEETGYDCEWASLAMLYQYLELNYSYHDIFYLSGAAYSLGATRTVKTPFKPPFKPFINPGSLTSLWKNDLDFISHLFGISYNLSYVSKITDVEQTWKDYWNNVKNSIKDNKPVWTLIDCGVIPWWREHFPSINESYNKGKSVGGHIIVLVGFNEANGTVCYNDMANSNYTKSESKLMGKYIWKGNETCEYIWMNISLLKKGVIDGVFYYWEDVKCLTLTIEKVTEPIPKNEAFELAHKRNLLKMQGWNNTVYDEKYKQLYKEFGIDALKTLKDNLKPSVIIPRLLFWRSLRPIIGFNPFDFMTNSTSWIKKDKQFAADSLLKQDNCIFCQIDGRLLNNESIKWSEFRNLTLELQNSFENDRFIKNILISLSILKQMNTIVDDIIHIEEEISNKR